jgi:hypothetical protein
MKDDENGWNDTFCRDTTIRLMVSPFVTPVKPLTSFSF